MIGGKDLRLLVCITLSIKSPKFLSQQMRTCVLSTLDNITSSNTSNFYKYLQYDFLLSYKPTNFQYSSVASLQARLHVCIHESFWLNNGT